MSIIVEPIRPPNYNAIRDKFPQIQGRTIFFAYGDRVYSPTGAKLTPELEKHEGVHLARQNGDPELWWVKYLSDPKFRLLEEVLAHTVELDELLNMEGNNRANRRRYLRYVAGKLASPIYGKMVPRGAAKDLLLKGLEELHTA